MPVPPAKGSNKTMLANPTGPQSAPPSDAATSKVAALLANARAIDGNLARFRKVEKEVATGTDGGGRMIAYLETQISRLISVSIFVSGGKTTERYYYTPTGALFHHSEIEQKFARNPKTGDEDYSKVISTKEHRYFFEGDRLIQASAGADATAGAMTQILREARFFAKAIQTADTSGEEVVDASDLFK